MSPTIQNQIDIPEDDVDPFEAEQLAEDKAAKKIMLENLTRIELIQRRREKDARDKERNKRRQEWKERRLQRAHQVRALQVCGCVSLVVGFDRAPTDC